MEHLQCHQFHFFIRDIHFNVILHHRRYLVVAIAHADVIRTQSAADALKNLRKQLVVEPSGTIGLC